MCQNRRAYKVAEIFNSNFYIMIMNILAHGLSIKVNAQRLLTEQNNGKGMLPLTEIRRERANQLTWSLVSDGKVAWQISKVDFPVGLSYLPRQHKGLAVVPSF